MTRSEPVRNQVATLCFQLGGAAMLAHTYHCAHLHDAIAGLQGVLADDALALRQSDGAAIRHALAGFEGIFLDLELDAGRSDLRDLRDALAIAHQAAARLAAVLERELGPAAPVPMRALRSEPEPGF